MNPGGSGSWEYIRLPRETVNDDAYVVTRVITPNGSKVNVGAAVVEVETSKANVEITSPYEGFLHHRLATGQRVEVGSVIAMVGPSEAPVEWPNEQEPTAPTHADARWSRAARELAAQHNLDPSQFEGLTLIRTEDVQRVLDAGSRGQPKTRPAPGDILVAGGGGHGQTCIDLLRRTNQFRIAGILDTVLTPGSDVLGIPVLGSTDELDRFFGNGFRLAVNGLGGAEQHSIREKLFNQIRNAGFLCPNLIHPAATVEASCRLGEGNQIMAGAVVGSAATLADNCIVNSNSVVSHDCRLGSNVHIAPGALLAGNVEVGSNSLIGMGVTVYLRVKIGANVTIANGVHVDTDVPDGTIVRR